MCATLTKTRTSISRKLCRVKSGFQILNAVEQFSSIFSKDKLKQGAHLHQTHDPPSPRMSWENCGAVPSQQLLHVLCAQCVPRWAGSASGGPGSIPGGFWRTGVPSFRCCSTEPLHSGAVKYRDFVRPLHWPLYYWVRNRGRLKKKHTHRRTRVFPGHWPT